MGVHLKNSDIGLHHTVILEADLRCLADVVVLGPAVGHLKVARLVLRLVVHFERAADVDTRSDRLRNRTQVPVIVVHLTPRTGVLVVPPPTLVLEEVHAGSPETLTRLTLKYQMSELINYSVIVIWIICICTSTVRYEAAIRIISRYYMVSQALFR